MFWFMMLQRIKEISIYFLIEFSKWASRSAPHTLKHLVHTRVSGTHKEISTGTQVFSTINMEQVNEIQLIEMSMDVEEKTIGEQRKNLNLNLN